MVYKRAYLDTVPLLHSAFILSMVKMLLKGEAGGRALNSHGNYIVDYGKLWNCVFEFLWEPCMMGNPIISHFGQSTMAQLVER